MSEIRKGFTPLPEAYSERVRFNVALPPYIDQEKIGVRLNTIHTLCRIGGINHLLITSTGDRTIDQPVVTGISPSGEATAGFGKLREKTIFTTDSQEIPSDYADLHPTVHNDLASRWTDGTIYINVDALSTEVTQNTSARDVPQWAQHLNKALQDGITHIGAKHLLLGLSKNEAARLAVFQAGLGSMADFHVYNPTDWSDFSPPSSVSNVMLIHLFINFMTKGMSNMSHWIPPTNSHENRRFSIFYGPQLDRALLLKLLASTRTLVKEISPQTAEK